jgi:pyrophosphatase PpaX
MRAHDWDAILFDLDGTLADSVALILACYRHTMRTHLGHEPGDDRWLEGLGTPLEVQLRSFARSADELIAMRETYIGFQRIVHDDYVRVFPGVPALLDTLRARGVALGVVTSKSREMAGRTMQSCGIERCFDIIITPEVVTRPKPHPEPVLAALRALPSARPSHVLFVGDAPVDMLAGRAAGVRTAAVLWGPFPRLLLEATSPDFIVENVAALFTLQNGRSPAGP